MEVGMNKDKKKLSNPENKNPKVLESDIEEAKDDEKYNKEKEKVRANLSKPESMKFTTSSAQNSPGGILSIDTSLNPIKQRRINHSPTTGQSVTTAILLSPKKDEIRTNSLPSPSTLGILGHIIKRKKQSLSFFVNLTSPTKIDSFKAKLDKLQIDPKDLDSATSPRSLSNFEGPQQSPTKGRPFQFPIIKGHLNRPSAIDQQKSLNSRLDTASIARERILEERRKSLIEHSQAIKFRLLIHDSRQRLEKMRKEAKHEYSLSNAELNRHILLRHKREKFGQKVEYAKRVMILQKMKKMMQLRRALSENFVDLLKQEQNDGFNDSENRVWNPLGLKLDIHGSDSDEGYIIKEENENDGGGGLEDSSNYIFSESPKSRSETISASIRRTKSLPNVILTENDDVTFLGLLNLLPPITRFTLRELDMDEILGNAQLRHDIVFDPDLQFKASSEEEEDQDQKTNAYWEELGEQVKEGDLYVIPLLLAEIRAILVELLPNGLEIKDEIFARIDISLINQQLQHGIMDPGSLIIYVSELMKTNCAPIRDTLVEEMVEKCKAGDIVGTLKICFDLMELMKLVRSFN
jgi:hypothetical protein